jgi:hypothetical protein
VKQRRNSNHPQPPGIWDRLFAFAGDRDGAVPAVVQLRWFRRYVLLYGVTRSWLWVSHPDAATSAAYLVPAVVLTAALGLAFLPRLETWAPRIAIPALLGLVWATFPTTPNHYYLELLAMTALATVGPQPASGTGRDAVDALAGLRWLTAIVFFQTGLQKVLYGCYFHGELFAYLTSQDPRFAAFFGSLLPAHELARLTSYNTLHTGSGPYRVDAPLVLLLSNLVWVAELVLPALMLMPRTRKVATLAAVAFVASFQLAAREAGFAMLFTGLLLLFLPRAPLRRIVPVAAVVCLWAVAAAFGVLPGGVLVRGINP